MPATGPVQVSLYSFSTGLGSGSGQRRASALRAAGFGPASRTRLRRGRGVSRGERRSSAEPARFCDTRTALSSLARSMSRHSSCFSGDLESDGPRGGWPWPPQQSKLALPSRSRVVQLANPSPQRYSSSSFRTTAGDYHWTVPAAGENLAQSRSVEGHDDAERRRLRVWRRRLGAIRGPRGRRASAHGRVMSTRHLGCVTCRIRLHATAPEVDLLEGMCPFATRG